MVAASAPRSPGSSLRGNGVVVNAALRLFQYDDFHVEPRPTWRTPTPPSSFAPPSSRIRPQCSSPATADGAGHRSPKVPPSTSPQTPNHHLYPVNVCRGQGNPSQSENGSNSLPATSFHAGGVNTLFVDGSVPGSSRTRSPATPGGALEPRPRAKSLALILIN